MKASSSFSNLDLRAETRSACIFSTSRARDLLRAPHVEHDFAEKTQVGRIRSQTLHMGNERRLVYALYRKRDVKFNVKLLGANLLLEAKDGDARDVEGK